MSQLNKENIKHIAKLAKLSLTETEVKKLADDLSQVVTYVEQLNELDTSDIEPMIGAVDLIKKLREDVAVDSKLRDQMLKNAPDSQDTSIKVPQMSATRE